MVDMSLSACPMLTCARMRRTMAESVSMIGTPATMSGMMSEVRAAVRWTLSSEMAPRQKMQQQQTGVAEEDARGGKL